MDVVVWDAVPVQVSLVLIAFEASHTDGKQRIAPSPAQYKAAMKKFKAAFLKVMS